MTFRNMIRLLVTLVLCLRPGHTFFDTFMYPCSAAMVCVDIAKCDKIGVMSKNDVILSKSEELFRSPLLPCRKTDGDQGVCCRDPDYKDDWPTDVKYYDQKGQYDPKPTIPKIIGADSKTTEVKECTPPSVKLPNGKCGAAKVVTGGSAFAAEEIVKPTPKDPVKYLPPKSGSQLKQDAECAPNEVRLPNGDCGVKTSTKPPLTYLPPVTPPPCPPGTKKGPNGKCESTAKVVPKATPKPFTAKPTLSYMPDRTYLPPPPPSQLKAVDTSINSIPKPPNRQNNEAKCSHGTIIEQNNKRYCCEQIS